MRILVVEDDEYVARTLKFLLVNYNYAVDLAVDGETGLHLVDAFSYDLAILDVVLPGMDGVSLCQQLRGKGYQMPILLLTGRGNGHEKAVALNTGADDYVVKPFDAEELMARVQALLRRGSSMIRPGIEWGELRIDPANHTATYGAHGLVLTPKEYAILELFLRNSQRIFSAGAILDRIWTAEEAPGEESVRGHIKEIRKKLKAVGAPADFIETVYRVGYRLKPLDALVTVPPVEQLTGMPFSEAALPSVPPALDDISPPKVMVVTKNPRLFTLLRPLLEAQALHSILAPDPAQLQENLNTYSPHLLLLDAASSDISSIPLCQTVRQNARWQRLPIVFVLATPDPDLIHQVFAAGADDFVTQPIIEPELMGRIINRLQRVQPLDMLPVATPNAISYQKGRQRHR